MILGPCKPRVVSGRADATIHDTGKLLRSRLKSSGVTRRVPPQPCRWCGRDVADVGLGRRRRYCRRSCRQRAYEQRTLISASSSLAPDAVVLSAVEAVQLSDRVYQVRCAAEDVVTALEEGAQRRELRNLCDTLMRAVNAADGWR